jgi:hypothetical protein
VPANEISDSNPFGRSASPEQQQTARAELAHLEQQQGQASAAAAAAAFLAAAGQQPPQKLQLESRRAGRFTVRSAAEACWRRTVALRWASNLAQYLQKPGLPRLLADLTLPHKIEAAARAIDAAGGGSLAQPIGIVLWITSALLVLHQSGLVGV